MSNHVGGQALIEGVMMRNGNKIATAVIQGDNIKVKAFKVKPLSSRNKLFSLPFIRGVFNLIDMTYIGMKEMIWSANESAGESDEKLETKEIVISIGFSIVFALLLFKVLPLGITKLLHTNDIIGDSAIIFNLIDGLIRISVFLLYIYIVSLFPDIRRVFEYHGAEHMTVNCYEAGEKLTIKNARKYTTIHSRCGTSFLFIVLIFAILIFSIVPIELPFFLLLFARLPFLFPIAGVAYEVLKLSAKYEGNPFFKALILPGLLFQKITTKTPDNRQIEVAIAALKGVVKS